jgi:hypothetical protein
MDGDRRFEKYEYKRQDRQHLNGWRSYHWAGGATGRWRPDHKRRDEPRLTDAEVGEEVLLAIAAQSKPSSSVSVAARQPEPPQPDDPELKAPRVEHLIKGIDDPILTEQAEHEGTG